MSSSSEQIFKTMLQTMAPTTPRPDQMRYDREFVIDRHMLSRDENMKSANKFSIINSAMEPSPNSTMQPVEITLDNLITLRQVVEHGVGVFGGKILLCRMITPSFKVNAVQFVVDDPDGDFAVDILLYNYPKDYVIVGSIFALSNPYFKLTKAGYLALRCENPAAHLEFLENDHPLLTKVEWKRPLPFPSGLAAYDQLDFNKAGIRCFDEKNYDRAIKFFTKALEKPEFQDKLISLYANRSGSFLAIERPDLALKDAEKGLEIDPNYVRLHIRKAHALLDLGRYEDCMEYINSLVNKSNAQFQAIMLDAKRALTEAKHGRYDYMLMFDKAKQNTYMQSHANHFAEDLVEIKDVTNFGRGLVAKRDIEPGTLIIAEKAFAFDIEDNSQSIVFGIDPAKQRASEGSSRLLAKICEKLKRNPSLGTEIYKLSAGPDSGHLDLSLDEALAKSIDVTRIKDILFVNAIETGQVAAAENLKISGLWIKPSYINHSCVDVNCVGQFVGDFMFVRSIKPITKGSQLLFQYCTNELFKERDHNLRVGRGFICKCRLCEVERNEDASVQEKMAEFRQRYLQIAKSYLEEKLTEDPIPELERLLEQVRLLRPNESLLNLLALRISKTLAMICMDKERMKLIEDAYEAYLELGIISEALDAASGIEMCHNVLQNEELVKPWEKKVRELAKLVLGDERLMKQESS